MIPRSVTLACCLAWSLLAVAQDAPDAGVADAGTAENPAEALKGLPTAQPIGFKIALDKAEVGLAEPFAMSIEIRHAPTENYELPVRFEWKQFGIRSQKVERSQTDPVVTSIHLALQAFEVGELEIPAIRLSVDTPEGAKVFELPAQKIKVSGVIDPAQGEPQMREDTRPLPTVKRPIWWPMYVIGAVLLAALGYWYYRRRIKRGAVAPPPKPRDPPDVEALAKLAALEQEELIASGRKRDYYFRLSEIVRDYVGRRFTFDALELTSDELLQELRRRSTPGLEFDLFAGFLSESDFVKFAKADPTDGEAKRAMDAARRLVEQSRPPPPAPPQGGAG